MSIEIKALPSMLSIYRRAIVKKRNPRFKAGDTMPELAMHIGQVAIDQKKLKAYNRVCGFAQGDCLPATYPQILAFPIQLEMLVGKQFPFPLLGLVHVSNRIELLKPIDRKANLAIEVTLGEQRVVDKGVEVDLLTEVKVEGELVWRGVATMLARCKTHVEKQPSVKSEPMTGRNMPWRLPANLGRRYGKASGDINPIHLFQLTAKVFGFKRAIAHGMWSLAKSLSSLDGQLPAAPYAVDVKFKLPIFLPAQVQFLWRAKRETEQSVNTIAFEVWNKQGEKPHLSGSVKPL